MEKIKERPLVLYILTKLELGGAQKVCLTLFKGVSAHGLSTGLISGAQGVLVPEVEGHENVLLLQEFKREVGIKNILSEIKTFFSLYRIIKKLKREHQVLIVHTHSTKAGVLGRWVAFFAGVKLRVHTVHGFGFHEFQSRFAWLLMMSIEYVTSLITTHYVCVSEADRAIGSRLFPRFTQKSSLIRAAVDWDSFYTSVKRISAKRDVIIGTVSCFKPQKNLIDLLQAFNLVCKKAPNAFLHIIGDGVLRSELESFVLANGLKDRVVFLGWQSDVARFMKEWDVFALSSLWEGLPCSIIEARLSRLPVVCYDVGGITEVIKNGRNGFTVQTGQWQELADRLLALARDEQLRAAMANFPDILDLFKNSSMIFEHEQLYMKLINTC